MTREHAKELLPIITAFAEGKEIQLKWGNEWCTGHDFYFESNPSFYRIKPSPKLRPWKPEEVPVGAVVRSKYRIYEKQLIVSCIGSVINLERDDGFNADYLLEHYEHSLDHGKTWHPCGVAEE